ncbi:hypothetical protein TRFO_00964 [Tritrichomonas foetus]|uniref:UBA domain-containing protein n=1 Tax=Tritrichomonas foetus TaxID=1144522 RepID=A0A1J4L2I9_9EUKA|nr:hypothetical protein TRFO_00964 [Tritrichomonas foetus]|eukprot:OHT17667.1 hypothetical protein TRFO_00964 [Tritrichomonas foetus]
MPNKKFNLLNVCHFFFKVKIVLNSKKMLETSHIILKGINGQKFEDDFDPEDSITDLINYLSTKLNLSKDIIRIIDSNSDTQTYCRSKLKLGYLNQQTIIYEVRPIHPPSPPFFKTPKTFHDRSKVIRRSPSDECRKIYREYANILKSQPAKFDDMVNQFIGMGYYADEAAEALRATKYDVEKTADLLLNYYKDSPQPKPRNSPNSSSNRNNDANRRQVGIDRRPNNGINRRLERRPYKGHSISPKGGNHPPPTHSSPRRNNQIRANNVNRINNDDDDDPMLLEAIRRSREEIRYSSSRQRDMNYLDYDNHDQDIFLDAMNATNRGSYQINNTNNNKNRNSNQIYTKRKFSSYDVNRVNSSNSFVYTNYYDHDNLTRDGDVRLNENKINLDDFSHESKSLSEDLALLASLKISIENQYFQQAHKRMLSDHSDDLALYLIENNLNDQIEVIVQLYIISMNDVEQTKKLMSESF